MVTHSKSRILLYHHQLRAVAGRLSVTVAVYPVLSDSPGRPSQGWEHCLHWFQLLPSTERTGWEQVVSEERVGAPWPSSWPWGLGSGCNSFQVRKFLQKTLSPVKFHALERLVWLTSSALPPRVSLSWDPMLRCLIGQRQEAQRGLWAGWQRSQGPARIWGDLEKNKATSGMSFSHLAKPVFSIFPLSWRWGGWQRCCCANLATNWGSHPRGRWSTSGT